MRIRAITVGVLIAIEPGGAQGLQARVADALPATPVVLIVPPPAALAAPEAAIRLQAELASAGLRPLEAAPDLAEQLTVSDGPLRAAGAVAAVRMGVSFGAAEPGANGDVGRAGIDVWVLRRSSARAHACRGQAQAAAGGLTALAGLRAVEILRACLAEAYLLEQSAAVSATDDAGRSPAPRNTTVAAMSDRPAAGWQRMIVGATAQLAHGFGAMGPALGPAVQLGYQLSDPLVVRAQAAALVWSQPVEGDDATRAHVQRWLFAAEVAYRRDLSLRITALLALGVGVHRLRIAGESHPRHQARTGGLWSAAGVARAGLLVALSRRLSAAFEIGALTLVPAPQVSLLGQPAGTLGTPSALLSLGLLVRGDRKTGPAPGGAP